MRRRGFVQVPNEVVFDRTLSLGARVTYAALKQYAWENRSGDAEPVELPPQAEIARALGVGVTALRGYIDDLEAAGLLVIVRSNRRKAMRYLVLDSADSGTPRVARNPADSEFASGSESGNSVARNPADSTALTLSLEDKSEYAGANAPEASEARPPKLVLVEGQNLGLNVLAEECSIGLKSPRLGQAVKALNGSNRPNDIGIREQFWRELDVVTPPWQPGEFEAMLADAISQRCEMYRRVHEGATLTPTALQRWWTDLPALAAKLSERSLTPAEIASGAWRQ